MRVWRRKGQSEGGRQDEQAQGGQQGPASPEEPSLHAQGLVLPLTDNIGRVCQVQEIVVLLVLSVLEPCALVRS